MSRENRPHFRIATILAGDLENGDMTTFLSSEMGARPVWGTVTNLGRESDGHIVASPAESGAFRRTWRPMELVQILVPDRQS